MPIRVQVELYKTEVMGDQGAEAAPAGAEGAAVNFVRGSTKPPLFEGTFELYRAELELYLDERNAWRIMIGDETRPENGDAEQAEFDRRDRLARATILRGLRGGRKNDDALKVCGLSTAAEMWELLMSDYTQRDFSYARMRSYYDVNYTNALINRIS
ncbi:Hypothetical protein PHPALM_13374 [Phytophthora palmivora]|uniref:Uncharacterized protein n=1 Tax=Phytophthora palmivora TaxID=4796 RepID=A0A2P4XXE4_9STRA|nr:Hypothetical protein PHPALM_13374 [Phytophthora palmivora]